MTKLISAVRAGDAGRVQALLQSEFRTPEKVNTPDSNGWTALHMASWAGKLDIVEALISAGAKVNQTRTDTGATPLFVAAQQGHEAVVVRLLDQGANVNQATTNTGATPLLIATQNGHATVVACLLSRGANVNQAKTSDGATPLFVAAQQGHEAVVARLLDQGAKVNQARTNDGVTPLYIAVCNGHETVVARLLSRGANVNQATTDGGGATPLLMATENGHETVVARLLSQGADVNQARTDIDATPLYIAACNGHETVVVRLLSQGAKVNQAQTSDGATPLFVAAEKGYEAVVTGLLSQGASVNQAKTNTGATPLIAAAQNGHETVVARLLSQGADVNQAKTSDGATPLFVAAQKGHETVVACLLSRGASVNQARTDTGATPLFVAAQNGHENVVAHLLSQGAEVNQTRTDTGATPLLFAAQQGHGKVIRLLLAFGADAHVACNHNTALSLAQKYGHTECIHIIEQFLASPDSCRQRWRANADTDMQAHNARLQQCLAQTNHQMTETDRQIAEIERTMAAAATTTHAGVSLFELAEQGRHNEIGAALASGASLAVRDETGNTPLLCAAGWGQTRFVQALLSKDASLLEARNHAGASALLLASGFGHLETAKWLVERYPGQLEQRDKDENTALMLSSYAGHAGLVKYLKEKGAVVSAKNRYGQSAYQLAKTDEIRQILSTSVTRAATHHQATGGAGRGRGMWGKVPVVSVTRPKASVPEPASDAIEGATHQLMKVLVEAGHHTEAISKQKSAKLESESEALNAQLQSLAQEQQRLAEALTAAQSVGGAASVAQTERIAQIEEKLSKIAAEHAVLWAKHQRKVARARAIRAFHESAQLAQFYTIVQLSIERIVIGCKAAASGFLTIKAADGKLARGAGAAEMASGHATEGNAKKALKAGKQAGAFISEHSEEISKGVEQGMKLLGVAFEFLPGAGVALKAGAKAVKAVADKRNENSLMRLSKHATLSVLMKASERFAYELTLKYQTQILALPSTEQERAATHQVKQKMGKAKQLMLKTEFKSSVEKLAEYAALIVLQSFHRGELPEVYSDPDAWQGLWLNLLRKPLAESTLVKECEAHQTEPSFWQLRTKLRKAWSLKKVYSHTGIHAQGQYYALSQAISELYGFRTGTRAEAQALEFVDVQSSAQTVTVVHDGMAKASRARLQQVNQDLAKAQEREEVAQKLQQQREAQREAELAALKQQVQQLSASQSVSTGSSGRLSPKHVAIEVRVQELQSEFSGAFDANSVEFRQDNQNKKNIYLTLKDGSLLEAIGEQISHWGEVADCDLANESTLLITAKSSLLAGKIIRAFNGQGLGLSAHHCTGLRAQQIL